MTPFIAEKDRNDPLWLRLKAYLQGRLEDCRQKNDGDAAEARTAKLRGQIAELKHLLDLDNPVPEVKISAD